MILPVLPLPVRFTRCVQTVPVFLVLLVTVPLAGCARTQPQPPPQFEPIALPATGLDPSPFEEILARRLKGVEAFRGQGVMELVLQGQSPRRFDFLVVADDAGRVRLRGERALGPPLFELVADTETFMLLIPTQRRAYQGRRDDPDPDTGLPVPGSVVDPVWIKLTSESLRFLERRATTTTLVELARAEPASWRLIRRIVFAQDTGLVERLMAFGPQAEMTQVVRLEDYRPLQGDDPDSAFPFRIEVSRPQAGLDLTLRFRSVEPNVVVPESAYVVTAPSGYTVLPASEFQGEESLRARQSPN